MERQRSEWGFRVACRRREFGRDLSSLRAVAGPDLGVVALARRRQRQRGGRGSIGGRVLWAARTFSERQLCLLARTGSDGAEMVFATSGGGADGGREGPWGFGTSCPFAPALKVAGDKKIPDLMMNVRMKIKQNAARSSDDPAPRAEAASSPRPYPFSASRDRSVASSLQSRCTFVCIRLHPSDRPSVRPSAPSVPSAHS